MRAVDPCRPQRHITDRRIRAPERDATVHRSDLSPSRDNPKSMPRIEAHAARHRQGDAQHGKTTSHDPSLARRAYLASIVSSATRLVNSPGADHMSDGPPVVSTAA